MRVALVALCPPRGAIADLVRQLIDHRAAVAGSDRVEFVPVVPQDLLTDAHPPGTIVLPYRDGRPLPSIAWARALRGVHALDVDAVLLYSQNIANLPVVAALRQIGRASCRERV